MCWVFSSVGSSTPRNHGSPSAPRPLSSLGFASISGRIHFDPFGEWVLFNAADAFELSEHVIVRADAPSSRIHPGRFESDRIYDLGFTKFVDLDARSDGP